MQHDSPHNAFIPATVVEDWGTIELPVHLHSSSIRQTSGGKWGTVAMSPFGTFERGTARMVLAAVLTLEAMAIAVIVAVERSAQRADEARISVFQKAGLAWKKALVDVYTGTGTPHHGEKAGLVWRKRLAEPILRPPSLAAKEASLQPDEIVIGIEAGGKAQAYRFAAFESKSGHLVNDLVGGVPVSVAYCDLIKCLRVYSDPQGSEPLDLNVAGLLNDEMVVRHGGKMYFHKSGKEVDPGNDAPTLPYPLITPTVTTWKEWTTRHPDTRVYIGKRKDVSKEERRPSAGPDQ
jgi:hypothetical protein